MEYKKSAPQHGRLDGRYVTFYQYEFPRATRKKGPFLPLGTMLVREYLYCDGRHGQLVQLITMAQDGGTRKSEQRVLVDKMLDIRREDKKLAEGTLLIRELSGEVREYQGRKLINIDSILAEREKIGMFASARLVRDSRRKQVRSRRWKARRQIAVSLLLLAGGIVAGAFLQKYDFFDLRDNAVYQSYLRPVVLMLQDLYNALTR